MDFKRLKQKDAAEAVGIVPRTLIGWKNAPRNADKTYCLPDLVAWMLKQAAGPSESEIDKISKKNLSDWRGEKAKLATIERKKAEKAVIDAAEVETRSYNAGQMIRDQLGALPDRIGPLVAACNDPFDCGAMIRKEIDFTLNHLADTLAVTP